jgi:hypothetical protein
MSVNTNVSVYVVARGGKFLGSKVNFASVSITGPSIDVRSQPADQGYPSGQDGSGITGLIMGQPLPWGTPVRTNDAAQLEVTLPLSKPVQVTVTVVTKNTTATQTTVSVQEWLVPGQDRTGANAILVEVPGLLVYPPQDILANPFVATVNMMCGCAIDNLFWPASNFDVYAELYPSGTAPLVYAGSSQFSVTLPANTYVSRVIAIESINGNTGLWTAPWSETPGHPPRP